jgi:acetamidase/formamidase
LRVTKFSGGIFVRLDPLRIALLLAILSFASPDVRAQAGNVVEYHTTINDVKYVYGVAEPVARLKPGDTTANVKGGFNPLSGPFYIEGAAPGDTLAVTILDVQVDSDISCLSSRTAMELQRPR